MTGKRLAKEALIKNSYENSDRQIDASSEQDGDEDGEEESKTVIDLNSPHDRLIMSSQMESSYLESSCKRLSDLLAAKRQKSLGKAAFIEQVVANSPSVNDETELEQKEDPPVRSL